MIPGLPYLAMASFRASTQKSASILLDKRQLKTLRLCQSMIATRYKNPRCIGIDCIRETLEAVHNGDQDVFQPAIFEIIHDGKPEFGRFIGRDPKTQNLAFALWRDAQSHVSRLVFNLSAFRIADFNPQGIEKNNRINRLQSAVLPVGNLLQNRIGDVADKVIVFMLLQW